MKKVLVGLAATFTLVIAGYVAFAATRPNRYHVERSRVIAASPDVIRAEMLDLRRWVEWNPWDALDPGMTKEFSEPSTGEGAWYTWRGNDDVGSGRMTIIRVTSRDVVNRLEFIEPFESVAEVTFRVDPEGAGSRVTWSMEGDVGFVEKLFTALMDWDSMIGPDFERGLESLERRVVPAGE